MRSPPLGLCLESPSRSLFRPELRAMFNALPIGPDVRAALAAGLAHEPRLDNRRAFFLIADLDSPRGGVIRVHPHNLLATSQSMKQ